MSNVKHIVFVTGGTGFVGSSLISRLLDRGHAVRALVRPGSESKLPRGCEAVPGNALDASTFSCGDAGTFVQLVGTPHPAPWKGHSFRSVDRVSLLAGVEAACRGRIEHFIYVSVAHPAPVMRAYIEVRQECERIIAAARLRSTILRPWYVLGPGRLWPYVLMPIYRLAEELPATRDAVLRLGLVTRDQMSNALLWAVENPPEFQRILNVPEIRAVQIGALKPVQ